MPTQGFPPSTQSKVRFSLLALFNSTAAQALRLGPPGLVTQRLFFPFTKALPLSALSSQLPCCSDPLAWAICLFYHRLHCADMYTLGAAPLHPHGLLRRVELRTVVLSPQTALNTLCTISVLAIPKTWSQGLRFHPTQFTKSPCSRSQTVFTKQ